MKRAVRRAAAAMALVAAGMSVSGMPALADGKLSFDFVGFFDDQGNKVDRMAEGKPVHAEFTITNPNSFAIGFDRLETSFKVADSQCNLVKVSDVRIEDTKVAANATSPRIKDDTYKVQGCSGTTANFAVIDFYWNQFQGVVSAAPTTSAAAKPSDPAKAPVSAPPASGGRVVEQQVPSGETPAPKMPVWMVGLLVCTAVLVIGGIALYVLVYFEGGRRRSARQLEREI